MQSPWRGGGLILLSEADTAIVALSKLISLFVGIAAAEIVMTYRGGIIGVAGTITSE